MKFEEVMKLLDAGYTKDEILAMEEAGADQKDNTGSDQKDKTGSDHASDDGTGLSAINDALGQVKETFESFKKEIIAMNIMNSRQDNKEQSADDILAKIINPFDNK